MTTIRAVCPTCGEVDLTADDIELRVSPAGSTYGFECPGCAYPVRKPADERVVQLLISGGVKPELEAASDDAPPFTHDDLLDFHFELESAEALKKFLKSA